MPAHHHPEAAPCGPAESADLASAAPLRRTGWPARRSVANTQRPDLSKPRSAARTTWQTVASTLTAIGLSLTLSACGIPRMIDSDVQSFVGTAGAATNTTYRFERLPSQQSQPEHQETIEGMAEVALQHVGLVRIDTKPRYSVQVEAQVVQFQPPPRRTRHRASPYGYADGSPAYSFSYSPLLFLSEPPWYGHTVHLVLRDTATSQVAYETSARFDGPWSDSAMLWPVIMEAALRDYPNPPQGPRKVTIELPSPNAPSHDR